MKKKGFFYRFVLIVTLCLSAAIARLTEEQVGRDYAVFRQEVYPKILEQVRNTSYAKIGPAVMFANSYAPRDVDKEEQAKIKHLILSQGWAVGGIAKRRATPEERAAIMTILKKDVASYISEKKPSTLHQTIIAKAIQTFRSRNLSPELQTIRFWVNSLTCTFIPVGHLDNVYLNIQLGNCLSLAAQLYDMLIKREPPMDMDHFERSVKQCIERLRPLEDHLWETREIDALVMLSSKKWGPSVALARQLTERMINDNKIKAIDTLAEEIAPDQQGFFVTQAKNLLAGMIDGGDPEDDLWRCGAINVLATKVSPKQWKDFVPLAMSLIQGMKLLRYQALCIKTLTGIHSDQWGNFISRAKTLIAGMANDKEQCAVIEILATIRPEEWVDFVPLAKDLIKEISNEALRRHAIGVLANVSFEKRKDFVQAARDRIMEKTDDSGRYKVIEDLGRIKPEELEEIMKLIEDPLQK